MVKLDTVKCGLPERFINNIHMQAFYENGYLTKRPGDMGTVIKVRDSLPMGLHEIKIELFKNEIKNVVLEFSAKILKGEYKEMISKDTIQQVECIINQNPFIQLKPDSLIQAHVFRVDVVNDLYIDEPEKGIQVISLLRNNNKYLVRVYGKNESVLFIRNAKTIKESLLFYIKGIELNKAKNKKFVSTFSKDDYNYFKKIIRVEQKMYSLEKIRTAFNITDNVLSGVLLSKSKPNYKLFKEIKGGITFMSNIVNAVSVDDLKWICVIRLFDYDIDKIEGILKPVAGKNLSRHRKKYKPLLEKLLSQNIRESGNSQILQDIENQLSV